MAHLSESLDLDALAASIDRHVARLREGSDPGLRAAAWELLDRLREPAQLRRMADTGAWSDRILALVEASDFTVGPLFRQRVARYAKDTLFVLGPAGRTKITWKQAADRVEQLARALIALDPGEDRAPIAILSENRIEMALIDLACLTSGLVNVLVPANATDADVAYILRHSRAGTLIVSGSAQLEKAERCRAELSELRHVVAIDPPRGSPGDVLTLDELLARAGETAADRVVARGDAVRASDVATVMYTSGTTGTPKGIQFTQRNIVFKRFARALALPEIGEDDVFVCFLPLYHTFGRFLELLGCVFWGATYCLLDNTSIDRVIEAMRRERPTVFISVPKKWLQLYEAVTRHADPLEANDEELLAATRRVTGGRLRWGLSAAGHLDSGVFRFFQRQGIELVSGFGMTEATGGISMTRPGAYRDGSLGVALPGIDLALADDGELLIRGPYVMQGYLDPPDDAPSFDTDGWFHTGDLMRRDEDGELQLFDRKKEIYKNVKGETIAPQRVENLFRDFESVGRTILIGDHRDYNTLLIYPNPAHTEPNLSTLSPQELHDHFRSLVVSVNKFLAPYERIVDFATIPRDLELERGELTPKGTPRRKAVEQNFSDTVGRLYRRTSFHVGEIELVLPNWLLQILGLTSHDFRTADNHIAVRHNDTRLTVERVDERLSRIGSSLYRHASGPLDLGTLVAAPRLWLGNEQLVGFAQLDTVTRRRAARADTGLEWAGRAEPYAASDDDRQALGRAIGSEPDLFDLDLAARMIFARDETDALDAVRLLVGVLGREKHPLAESASMLLQRLSAATSIAVRRLAFAALLPALDGAQLPETLKRFLDGDEPLLDGALCRRLGEENLDEVKLSAFEELTRQFAHAPADDARSGTLAASLLAFLASYGAAHPMRYRRIRAVLEYLRFFASRAEVREAAAAAAETLRSGFREWLGPSYRIAVDPETGQEYRWEEVVVFDDDVPERDRVRLLSALKNTALLKEGVFLFSTGSSVRLSDIPPGGVWIRPVSARHGKSIYRVTVQTRFEGSYDLAVNLNQDLGADEVQEEIHLLILCGASGRREPLVEDYGGYWPDQDLWSEEYIAGETLDRALRRLARGADGEARLRQLWPFLAWTTLSAYTDFWNRAGRRLEIADPVLSNFVVPTEDYQTGGRIVSLSRRRPHEGLLAMMRAFRETFVEAAESQYPALTGVVGWPIVFSSLVEVLGEEESCRLFREALAADPGPGDGLCDALRAFLQEVERDGFVPKRLFFAIERYRRWSALSADATLLARGLTLREIYETYGLRRLAPAYPEIRVRFFLDTAFRGGSPELLAGLRGFVVSLRRGETGTETMVDAVNDLRAKIDLSPEEDYFLARLSHPYLKPEDSANFVRAEQAGRGQSEIVVTLDDDDGQAYRVRHALNPKEVERLHRLFLSAKLDVRFRMEHQYLVAIDQRDQIVGGIYYELDPDAHSAHLEKIVVADRYRRLGVADGLMQELFNRLRMLGATTLTTGFFRPEYFYRFGFRIEKRYAGLVKSLTEPASEPGSGSTRS